MKTAGRGIIILALAACMAVAAPLRAEDIRKIVVVGSSVDIGFEAVLGGKTGRLDKKDIEALGAEVTSEYHRRGYTTSYVDRFVVTRDGTLEIHVRESRVMEISVSGVGEGDAGMIAQALMPHRGELYNRNTLQERMEQVKRALNLESLRITPLNYRDSADVFLSVKAEKKSLGRPFFVLGVDPIYGIMPELGYLIPGGNSALTLRARAGYREGEVRKAEGDIRYTRQSSRSEGLGFSAGIQGGRTVDIWESMDADYTVLSCAPYTGIGYLADLPGSFLLWVTLNIRGTASRIGDYREEGSARVNYDAALVLDVNISDRYYRLEKRESSDLSVTATAGRSDLEPGGYCSGTAGFRIPLSPVHRLRFVPRANSSVTTSGRRFYWSYVFDKNLMGFPDDFTASRWKNTAGLDAEIELAPRFMYAGPFVNYGYFLDEEERWESATGTGVKGAITYKDILVEAYYAWDAARSPSRGGLYIFAESSF